MRIVVFDPNLSKFGHHVNFNCHLLRVLDAGFADLHYLDFDGVIAQVYGPSGITFSNLSLADNGGPGSAHLSGDALLGALKTGGGCAALWKQIQALTPDLVIMASEGANRKLIFDAIPPSLAPRVYAIIHPVWLVINDIDTDANLARLYRSIGGMFVLEPFLADKLALRGIRSFWFPHRSYDSTERNHPSRQRAACQPLRIGTIGVINERRNHRFLIDAISELDLPGANYLLAGQLMASVATDIISCVASFPKCGPVRLQTEFGYLEETQFNSLVSDLDTALLAYDRKRNLQASGAIYSMAEKGIPTIAPDTALFVAYSQTMPGLVRLYPQKNADGLREALQAFDAERQYPAFFCNLAKARDKFVRANALELHRAYVTLLITALLSGDLTRAARSLLTAARDARQAGHSALAEGQALAAAAMCPELGAAYDLGIHIRFAAGYRPGVAHLQTLCLAATGALSPAADQPCRLAEMKLGEVVIWPPFSEAGEMETFLARFAWHFSPISAFITRIHLFTEPDYKDTGSVNPAISKSAMAQLPLFDGKLSQRPAKQLDDVAAAQVLCSLVWRYRDAEARKFPFPRSGPAAALYNRPIWRVDEENERFATSHFLKAASEIVDMASFRDQSHRDFRALAARFTAGKVAVFGTGPSLSNALQHDFVGIDTIAANSMVKNIPLLDHLQPKLIVCADPIFHAGASVYAEEFRRHLRFALGRYACPVMVPERDRHIYELALAGSGSTILSVPLVKRDLPNFDLNTDFSVTSTGNILTLFLLPVAFSLANQVDIWGCDGRPREEKSYFWTHDKSAQLNEQMDAIQRAHPGFFKIDYDEYYDEHCAMVDRYLVFAENIGKTSTSCSFSHIPALKSRQNRSINLTPLGLSAFVSGTNPRYELISAGTALLCREAKSSDFAAGSERGARVAAALAALPAEDPVAAQFRIVLQYVYRTSYNLAARDEPADS